MSFRYFYIIFLCIMVSGCGIKRSFIHDHSVTKKNVNIFLELPQNDLVFEHVSPLVYDVFTEHFERIGYKLVARPTDGYTLRIIIKSLEPSYKYISPDIVLFHTTTRVDLLVQLLDYKKEIVVQKNFAFSALISNPHNPVLNSDFLEFEYTRLLRKAAPKVEQYFRSYLLKSAD